MSTTTTTDKNTDTKAAGASAENKSPANRTSSDAPAKDSKLASDQGTTTIADIVVQKVAGLAAREVRGVHDLGGGAARAFGAIRDRIPGASASVGQGVSVEVGETQAAVDLELVVEYGVAIADLARAVRRNVINAIEQMTGLDVVEVNINVNDVYIPGDEDENAPSSRVQ
ncbi:putative alkaline shock family protein YloU [Nocardia tenerifensis]|uniref:Putative alkaline shock family protein YloU n=1 Tax=Nocardia tenerifensis TaxID=228006 RepID=A0A318K8Z3_9NOCA|nr:Asp23/Gls24 family envelope stress response protein [Nocardia tenerifensis]PXX60893.1 putative alkaline shock family protein YloU [Nocardia tenerifensis]